MSNNDHLEKIFRASDAGAEFVDNIIIDFAIFSFQGRELKVLCLLHPDAGGAVLPCEFLHSDTRITHSARRHLEAIVAADHVYHEQLKVFDDQRAESERSVLRIAYYALLAPEYCERVLDNPRFEFQWRSISDALSAAASQEEILRSSLEFLRHKVRQEPIVFDLLPEKFTLSNLQEAYEAILDVQFRKSNFRRKLARMSFLVRCQERQKDVAHRAAELYRFDRQTYEQVRRQGFDFAI